MVATMNTEQKAKAYDEAYKKVAVRFGSNVADEIFPKESKDERIRKALIKFHKSTIDVDGIKGEDIIAWLEKQGEQKPADKVETKFKVWDSIKTTNEETLTITKIDDKGYWSEDLFICGFDDDAKWELVEQKPAWSEEDDRIYYSILADIRTRQDGSTSTLEAYYNEKINWLKSLKERINGKQ